MADQVACPANSAALGGVPTPPPIGTIEAVAVSDTGVQSRSPKTGRPAVLGCFAVGVLLGVSVAFPFAIITSYGR